jgi:diadenosine tetraphosphate (Ap4A) HIT family hydrolase
VALDHLWAGWRSAYVSSIAAGEAPEPVEGVTAGDGRPCIFCTILRSPEPDKERHVVWSGRRAAALLNAFPYASGHLLVMPVRHVGDIEDLEGEEAAELWAAVRDAVVALKAAYRPDGLNLGVNLGRGAGAGLPEHLHVHALPRWVGDTSFVTSVASLRVLPEALPDSWAKLRAAWPAER